MTGTVGSGDGLGVGEGDGLAVGEVVGLAVGEGVGEADGDAAACADGVSAGVGVAGGVELPSGDSSAAGPATSVGERDGTGLSEGEDDGAGASGVVADAGAKGRALAEASGVTTTGDGAATRAAPVDGRGGRSPPCVTATSAEPTVAAVAAISTAVLTDAGSPSAAPMPLPAAAARGGPHAATGGTTSDAGGSDQRRRRQRQPRRQGQERQRDEAAGGARQRPSDGGATLLVSGPEGPARPGQQHLDRPGRETQTVGHLHQRQAVDVFEEKSGALPSGQVADRGLEQPLQLGLLVGIQGRGHLAALRGERRPAGGGAQVVVAAIECEPVEPGSQHDVTVPRKALVDTQEDVLRDVLRVGGVPHDPEREVVDAGCILLLEGCEGVRRPLPQAGDETRLGRLAIITRLRMTPIAPLAPHPSSHRLAFGRGGRPHARLIG